MKMIIIFAVLLMSSNVVFADAKKKCEEEGTYWNAQATECNQICPEGTRWSIPDSLCLSNVIISEKGAVCPPGMAMTISEKELTGSIKIGNRWLQCLQPKSK